MLNLNTIMINSDKPKELSKFYSQVLQEDSAWQGGDFVGYKAGNSYLMIGPHSKVHGVSASPERLIFNLETDDVKGEFDRIKGIEGATVVQEPYSPGENSEMLLATFSDCDGNYFQLASPMKM